MAVFLCSPLFRKEKKTSSLGSFCGFAYLDAGDYIILEVRN